MNDEKTNKIMSSEELDDVLPKYEPIKLSGKNLAQNYVSAFNTGMNIYQCINYLQGNIDWTINAVNDVVNSWNTEVSESIDQSKAIARETTTEQFNTEWTNKQPELIEQVNTLTTNQFNNEKSVFNDELDTLNARMDTFSNPNLLINPDFKINQRGSNTYTTTSESPIYTVDRWMSAKSKVDVNSNGTVTITSLSTNGSSVWFKQLLENTIEGACTLSCEATSVTGDVYLFSQAKGIKLKQGINKITLSDLKQASFELKQGASVTLKWVKLEQGAVATIFIAPNRSEELVKCQHYMVIFEPWRTILNANTDASTIYIDTRCKMRTKPTVSYITLKSGTLNQFNFASITGGEAYFALKTNNWTSFVDSKGEVVVVNTGTGINSGGFGQVTFDNNFILDAEIY